MNTGDFQDVLVRGNINPRYNHAIQLITKVNESVADIEDRIDDIINGDISPNTEILLTKEINKLDIIMNTIKNLK